MRAMVAKNPSNALARFGLANEALKEQGRQLRGEHYRLDYRKAAVPGDRLVIKTTMGGLSGRLHAIEQSVTNSEGSEVLVAQSIYSWQSSQGEPTS